MKKFALLLLGLLWLGACKEGTDYQLLDDEALATAIADDRGKTAVNPAEIPVEVMDYIESDHFDSYIESSTLAAGKGYELTLATEERLYFNLRGRHLVYRGGPTDGPCGHLGGELIPLDQLRPAIVEYIQEHYDAHILKAKKRGDKVIVLLSNHLILVFSADGVFEIDAPIWWDCLSCAPANTVDIPQTVLDMIQDRLPGAEIVRVCRRGGKIVLGVVYGDGRKILVFDQDWNFLFSHP